MDIKLILDFNSSPEWNAFYLKYGMGTYKRVARFDDVGTWL